MYSNTNVLLIKGDKVTGLRFFLYCLFGVTVLDEEKC